MHFAKDFMTFWENVSPAASPIPSQEAAQLRVGLSVYKRLKSVRDGETSQISHIGDMTPAKPRASPPPQPQPWASAPTSSTA